MCPLTFAWKRVKRNKENRPRTSLRMYTMNAYVEDLLAYMVRMYIVNLFIISNFLNLRYVSNSTVIARNVPQNTRNNMTRTFSAGCNASALKFD